METVGRSIGQLVSWSVGQSVSQSVSQSLISGYCLISLKVIHIQDVLKIDFICNVFNVIRLTHDYTVTQ